MSNPGRDGFYRCPNKCGNPDYPQPKWKTQKGFDKHMAECSPEPPVPTWVPLPRGERRKWGECEDCGCILWELASVWWMRDRIVCLECRQPYQEAGIGHHDAAGLVLPGLAMEG